jgi:hypothetical protein
MPLAAEGIAREGDCQVTINRLEHLVVHKVPKGEPIAEDHRFIVTKAFMGLVSKRGLRTDSLHSHLEASIRLATRLRRQVTNIYTL